MARVRLVFPARSMVVFTQWSSSVPSYLLYKKRDTILLQPLFPEGRWYFCHSRIPWWITLFCALFIIHLDPAVYHQPSPLLASQENAKHLYLPCVRYALSNLITLQTVLFVSSFRVSFLVSCLHCRLLAVLFWSSARCSNCLRKIGGYRFSYFSCEQKSFRYERNFCVFPLCMHMQRIPDSLIPFLYQWKGVCARLL